MKRSYLTPLVNTEQAEPTNIICGTIISDNNTGLTEGGGSDGDAHAPESTWELWDEE